jgi:hypothetical protein
MIEHENLVHGSIDLFLTVITEYESDEHMCTNLHMIQHVFVKPIRASMTAMSLWLYTRVYSKSTPKTWIADWSAHTTLENKVLVVSRGCPRPGPAG